MVNIKCDTIFPSHWNRGPMDNFVEISGYKFDNMISFIYICDDVWFRGWSRDNKLNILLNNNETTNG